MCQAVRRAYSDHPRRGRSGRRIPRGALASRAAHDAAQPVIDGAGTRCCPV